MLEKRTVLPKGECVEIIGMSNWIVHIALEKTVWKVLAHIGAYIFEEKLELYHRLNKKSNPTIVNFLGDSKQVMKVKKHVKDLNPSYLDFPEGTRLFINGTLCSYYRVLWNKNKKLWINKKKKNNVCIKNMGKEGLNDYF